MMLLNGLSPFLSISLWLISLLAILDMYSSKNFNYVWINLILFIVGLLLNLPSLILVLVFSLKYKNYYKHFKIMSLYIDF